METVKAQVLQEQQIRSVTEACLTEERAVWHHVQRLIVDTRKKCEEMKESLRKLKSVKTYNCQFRKHFMHFQFL